MWFFRGGVMKRLVPSVVGIAALVAAAAAFAAPNATATTRLVYLTSPVHAGTHAILVARVHPARRCTITVYYKSGPSHARGLYPKRPVHGRVSWTWLANPAPGRYPIYVDCGSAGFIRTHIRVT
jgi:micrococcal nuclease